MSESRIAKSPRQLRDELETLIRDDLIGPLGGPQEELEDAPVDRYVLGLLAPRFTFGSPPPAAPDGGGGDEDGSIAVDLLPEDGLADAGITADSGEEGTVEDRPPAVDQLVPAAFGLTFALDGDCGELRVRASWGAYSKETSEERLGRDGRPARVWRRRPCGGGKTIAIAGAGPLAPFAPDPAEPDVEVRGLVRVRGGHRLVSLFLVNGQFADSGRSVPRWLCQASLSVEHPGGEAVFVRRAIDVVALAPVVDREELAGLEMQYRDSVELAVGHGVGVQAVESLDRPGRGVRLGTAAMPAEEVPRTDAPGPEDFADPSVREPFTAAFAAFDMKTLSEAIDGELPRLLSPLADAYDAWIAVQAARIADPDAGLDDYQVTAGEHLDAARGIAARIRAGIGALADPDVAEAFRFANHAMWQQRVHTIAADARRRDDALKLHDAVAAADVPVNRSWRPFQLAFVLGLWVGQASTPNRTEDAEQWVRQARQRSGGVRGSSPLQLARCPWCGSQLEGGRDVEVDRGRDRTLLTCSDTSGQCAFTPRNSPDEGLPVVVVDEEVYRLLPSLVIATVDKLARMPWEGRVQALFGQVSRRCERHGYLTPGEEHPGSHPKRGTLPAATVIECGPLRRRLAVFPPPGLDARDSFFTLWRDRPEDQDARPGRRYLGVCAPGRRYKQVLIRVYVAQLNAAWTVLGRQPGDAADAYMTLVGYFNSLRELGGMRRLVEDDIQNRLYGGDGERRGRLFIEELTSRKLASDIPGVLDRLFEQRLSQAKREVSKDGGGLGSIDVLLATNMISVGVDIPRLGTMVVAGQPKSTSEYIQATSRVGRQHPGMVIAVYNWARPRDLSHYETFCHYHRTLYRQVEALSVTPFAPRALDRGLTGVLASLLRLSGPAWNANPGAGLVDPAAEPAARAREAIRKRAEQVDHDAAELLAERVNVLLEAWKAEAAVGQRTLVYQRRGRSGSDISLLQEPGIEGWSRWTVPTSMRNVETAVPLKLRPDGITAPAEDWDPPERSAPPHEHGEDG